MSQVCSKCSRVNPADAAYCYFDGAILEGHSANGGPVNPGAALFPSQFVFPSGQTCRNFDQLALACQQNWQSAVELLKQGFLSAFLGGLGRADLALAAQEAARFPDQDRGLDQLLAKLPSHVIEEPKLKVEPSQVNLGQIAIGTDRHLELHLGNQGMRLLFGSVVSDCKWLSLGEAPGSPQKLFQCGAETTVAVNVHGKHLRAGTKPLEGKLVIESNGGTTTVVVVADVPVKPFTEGVLAGAISPRQIAEKALKTPKEAAPWFEKGAVAQWFTLNGWTYPVQGPSASGLGAVQQFFEALGLAKAPKVGISTTSLSLRGQIGQAVQTTLEVKSEEKRPVYAHATCDQAWLDVSKTKLNGRIAIISVRVPSVPNRPGETLQAKINVTGNGNQRFVVPLTLAVEGSSPFADLVPVEAVPASGGGDFVEAVAVMAEPAPAAAMVEPAAAAGPAGAFADLSAPPPPSAGVASATLATRAPAIAPRSRRERKPVWKHLLPLGLLALGLVAVLARDLWFSPAPGSHAENDPELRIGLYFDYAADKKEVQKLKLNQTMNFGLVKIDDPNNRESFKKLTYDHRGRTNSTMVKIDGRDHVFASPTSGKWESRPAHVKRGMTASWLFTQKVLVTPTVEIIPGEPVEIAPGIYKNFLDTCLVKYEIKNIDKVAHKVSLRLLLDTLIGDNDAPTFTVPGFPNLVNTNADFVGPAVPDFIQALERPNIKSPGTIAQLNFRLGNKLEVPSRVSVTHWPDLLVANKTYDIPVKDIKDDSSIVLYWKEVNMAPGQVRTLGFTFGLGNVSAEGLIGLSVGGSFAPGGELTVVALVSEPKAGQKLTLELPKELSLVDAASKTQAVPQGQKLADGKIRPSPVTWRVRSSVAGTYNLEVKSSTGPGHKLRVTIKTSTLF